MNTYTGMNRRGVLSLGVAASAVAAIPFASAQQSDAKPIRPEPARGARQDLDLVRSFVGAGHKDANIAQVKELLDRDPKLVFASHDWGEGDWETALGGASHTGSREMARYLLSRGARIDSFCAAMLAEREVLAALVAANPSVATSRGPHGYTLLYHVAIGGDVVMADLLKPHLGTQPRSYTQALSAAVRDGHLAMTKWLFEHGEADPNVEDALGRRPLSTAIAKGFQSVADELRRHGARESD
jgi:ankyrin repeat protein